VTLDSHTHAWGPPTPDRPWVNDDLVELLDLYDVDTVYESSDLVADMDAAGVDEAVLVPFPLVDWTDNRYVVEAVQRHEELVGGIVMLDPFADDAADRLGDLLATPGVLGVRIGVIYPREHMWQDDYFDPGESWLPDAVEQRAFWETAREADGLVQLFAHRDQLAQVATLADAYPDLPVLVDHLAHVDPSTPPDEGSFARFAALAERPNVAVKVSEVPHLSGESYPYRDLHEHVGWLLERFGRERLIWGSDYPNISRTATYEEGLTWLEHVPALSATDREWLTGRSFRRVADL
jgi:predicted TIM-barrel fold metal-dependent hydrolase